MDAKPVSTPEELERAEAALEAVLTVQIGLFYYNRWLAAETARLAEEAA